jgi:hypothetical protein
MGLLRRVVALQLAIALPAVVGARLALDIRSAPHAYSHVETKHGESCADGHDHTLCVLVFAAPWSDAAPAPRIKLSTLPESVPPLVAYRCDYEAQIRLAFARAPPPLIPLA